MTRYVLDTNHAGALFRNDVRLAARLEEELANVSLCVPVIGELWFMVLNSTRVDANRAALERLLTMMPVLEFDLHAAEEFGRIRTECRRAGRPMPQIDTQISAIARIHGLTVLTADAHFKHVENLNTENWLI